MRLEFTVSGRIARPVTEVFEAVVAPERLAGYFATGGASARLEPGHAVAWRFADHPAVFMVDVVAVEPDRRIVLRWEPNEGGHGPNGVGYETTVTMTFAPLEGERTLVSIHEQGWRDGDAGLRSCLGNCEGWTGMLMAMKAWLEHGINLREGFYS